MEEIRKIIRESIREVIQEEREQRYVATMDFYIWAEDDDAARAEAKRIAGEMDSKYDNQPRVTELGKQPHGTLNYFKIDL